MSGISVTQTTPVTKTSDAAFSWSGPLFAIPTPKVAQDSFLTSIKATPKKTVVRKAPLTQAQKIAQLEKTVAVKLAAVNKEEDYNHNVQYILTNATPAQKTKATTNLNRAQKELEVALKALNLAQNSKPAVPNTKTALEPEKGSAEYYVKYPELLDADLEEARAKAKEQQETSGVLTGKASAKGTSYTLTDTIITPLNTEHADHQNSPEETPPPIVTVNGGTYIGGDVVIHADGATVGGNLGVTTNSILGNGNRQTVGAASLPDVYPAEEELIVQENRRTYLGASVAQVSGRDLTMLATWNNKSTNNTHIYPGIQYGLAVGTTLDKKGNWTGEIFGTHSKQKFDGLYDCGCFTTGEIATTNLGVGVQYNPPTKTAIKPYGFGKVGFRYTGLEDIVSKDPWPNPVNTTVQKDGGQLNVFADIGIGVDYVHKNKSGKELFRVGPFVTAPLAARVHTKTGDDYPDLINFTQKPFFGIRAQLPLSQPRAKEAPKHLPMPVTVENTELLPMQIGNSEIDNLTPTGTIYSTEIPETGIEQLKVRTNNGVLEKMNENGEWVPFETPKPNKKSRRERRAEAAEY